MQVSLDEFNSTQSAPARGGAPRGAFRGARGGFRGGFRGVRAPAVNVNDQMSFPTLGK